MAAMTNTPLRLTGDPDADQLLTDDDNALLIGMVMDQQVPMEKAFSGPLVIAQRMAGGFDVAKIAAMTEDEFVALCAQRPAIHRFPAAMGKRIYQVCRVLTEKYDGQAANLWNQARSGEEVKSNLAGLPGFGADKAAIFTAVLGKQRGVTPEGWRTAAGYYGEPDTYRSVADIVDDESLQKVRETKRSVKAAKKAAS
jgi:uncharacterized HhH-GPD family protein